MTAPALKMGPSNVPGSEIIHFFDSRDGNFIESRGPHFKIHLQGRTHRIRLPLNAALRCVSPFRFSRRFLRIDKANAVMVDGGNAVIFLYMGGIYRWSPEMPAPQRTGTLRQCRNVLHQSIAVVGGTEIFFGEYGANSKRQPVPVWASRDAGRSWNVVHEFPAGTIKHVHGVYHDPYTDDLWIPTGDFDNECFLYRADRNFKTVQRFGDGTQTWRTVGLIFQRERISWVMDSQLERSYLCHMDRATGALTRGAAFPGPVWYVKSLDDGVTLVQTTREIGDGVSTNFAHLFASRDIENWVEVTKFEKDSLPMRFFKFGVLGFADGPQTSARFAMFGEALRGFDGHASICSLQWN